MAHGPKSADPGAPPDEFEIRSAVSIPLRDGIHLTATLYLPALSRGPSPCVVALTPYVADHLYDRGSYFAARGLPFLAVDVRGRGDSEGMFRPLIQEAQDGYDVVEWLAQQPYCDGRVGMYGGSYLGYAQWATAKEFPPHLKTITPVASPCLAVDVPIRGGVFALYQVQWLIGVGGRAAHDKLSADPHFWSSRYCRRARAGEPVRVADRAFGNPLPVFQEWLNHPEPDAFWDAHNPTAAQYAGIDMPVLTLTGAYDGDQPGALEHYRQHLAHASNSARQRHYLVIGPWNHVGCAVPSAEFDGITAGPASVINLRQLHFDWYAWTLQGGPKPEFLRDRVAYYVLGKERWRYAATLDAVTARSEPLFFRSAGDASDVFKSGTLDPKPPTASPPDRYVYDPRDRSEAVHESAADIDRYLVDQGSHHRSAGKKLFYHTEPFQEDLEISGFFKWVAWISIDQPDTDFRLSIYEIDGHGRSVLLTWDTLRARYRENPRKATLVETSEPLRYVFDGFTFVSRQIARGHRLRVVLGPVNSIYEEINHNSGGTVADESIADGRPVTVQLFHEPAYPTALYVPWGQPD